MLAGKGKANARLRRPCLLRAAGQRLAKRRRLRREGRADCFEEADTEKVFAAMIFDNCNDFQQPRLPVLTIWGLRDGAFGL